MNPIHLFIVVLFALELIKCVPQRIPAFFVENPCIFFVDEIVEEFDQVLNAWTCCELLLGGASEFKEVSAEPDLFYVGLMTALSDYLLYCIFFMAFFVLP
jgi:hypothetical protein